MTSSITYYNIKLVEKTICSKYSGNFSKSFSDLIYFCIQNNLSTKFLEKTNHRIHQSACSAFRKIHSPFPFEKMNECVDGRSIKGISSHQQRMKLEKHIDEDL